MRISDWSSDVCSSDLFAAVWIGGLVFAALIAVAVALVMGEWRGLTRLKLWAYRAALAFLAAGLALAIVDVRLEGLLMAAALIGAGSLLLLTFAGPPAFGLAYAGLPAVAVIWLCALPWGDRKSTRLNSSH